MANVGHASSSDVEASTLYARATAAEHACDFDTAFRLYLSAAQAYLHRVRTLPPHATAERTKCKTNAGICLERAERIKVARRDALKPLVRDPFSKEEQTYVLDKSSKVHGISLPVWAQDDIGYGKDPDASILPPFGDELLPSSPVWSRPSDVYGSGKFALAGQALHPRHIHQNIVSDCSVCSAAAICLHHHRMFNSQLGLECLFPHDSSGFPLLSEDGVYAFRLFVNGAFRRVSIDDRLPFTEKRQALSVMAVLEDGSVDVWPALLEKAYLKLMGGYDFPGSNSSIDVHALTGWIPEHIEINSSAFVREKAFRRICEGFNQGFCVLTLGTSARAQDTSPFVSALDGSRTKLLPSHSYAVLAIHEISDERYMTILNPWNASSGTVGGPHFLENMQSLHIGDEDPSTGMESDSDGATSEPARRTSASLIDISWDEVCTAFDGLYLNWDPSLFKHTLDFHGLWRSKAGENTLDCVHYYLSLDLTSSVCGGKATTRHVHDLWVLLTRHVVDKQRSGEFIAIHAVQSEREEESMYDSGVIDAGLDLKGLYTSSTHILTRLTVTGLQPRVSLIASYDGPYSDVCFTVQVFCNSSELSWVSQPHNTAFERLIEGIFSSRNSGGNSTYSTFMNNPQYRLRLHPEDGVEQPGIVEKGRKYLVRLIVEGPRDVPLNVMLVWRTEEDSRERVYRLGPGDGIASSGPYTYGVAQAVAPVTPGHYCIVVSTFEPRHRGKFTLRIESALRMDLEDIPAEGAGMFCKSIKGAWQPGMDGGSPRFGSYDKNPMFEITARTATTLKLRLQLSKPSASIALNVTLFASSAGRSILDTSSASSPSILPPLSSGSNLLPRVAAVALDRQIVTSGAYVDGSRSPAGVVTPQAVITPGRYIAVVSTFDPCVHTSFQLSVFSKADVKVSPIQ